MPRQETMAHLGRAPTTMDLDSPSSVYATDREYVPPNGGYGWLCVLCVFLINAHTWGLNFVS